MSTAYTRTPTDTYIPPGLAAVTPYLILHDVLGWVAFVERVFGARLVLRSPETGAAVRHVRIVLDGASIEAGQASGPCPASAASLHVYVPDADATFAAALAAGATELYPLADQEYGERSGGVQDPFGVTWFVATASAPEVGAGR